MKKKLFSLFLILTLVVTCFTACGDKEEGKNKKKKKASSYDSVYDLMEAITKVEKGTTTISFDVASNKESVGKISITTRTDGKNNCAFGISADIDEGGKAMSIDVQDLLIICDSVAYIDLGQIVDLVAKNVADVDVKSLVGDTKLGYFAIPLPDVDIASKAADLKDDGVEDGLKLIEKMLKDSEVEGEGKEFTIKMNNMDAYMTALNAFLDFFEENGADYAKEVSEFSTDDLDLNAYVKKLIDFYYDDAVKVADSLGLEKAMIDQYVDQIKSMDLNEVVKEAMEKQEKVDVDPAEIEAQIAEMVKEMREDLKEATEEDFEGATTEATLKATDNGFKISVDFSGENTAEEAGKEVISGSLVIKINEEDYKVEAPSNVTKLGDLTDIAKNLGSMME